MSDADMPDAAAADEANDGIPEAERIILSTPRPANPFDEDSYIHELAESWGSQYNNNLRRMTDTRELLEKIEKELFVQFKKHSPAMKIFAALMIKHLPGTLDTSGTIKASCHNIAAFWISHNPAYNEALPRALRAAAGNPPSRRAAPAVEGDVLNAPQGDLGVGNLPPPSGGVPAPAAGRDLPAPAARANPGAAAAVARAAVEVVDLGESNMDALTVRIKPLPPLPPATPCYTSAQRRIAPRAPFFSMHRNPTSSIGNTTYRPWRRRSPARTGLIPSPVTYATGSPQLPRLGGAAHRGFSFSRRCRRRKNPARVTELDGDLLPRATFPPALRPQRGDYSLSPALSRLARATRDPVSQNLPHLLQ
jgi:hypothetical protein